MLSFYSFICLLFQCSANLQCLLSLYLQLLGRKCNQSMALFWSNARYIVTNFLVFPSISSSVSFLYGTPVSYHITNTVLELSANVMSPALIFNFMMFISLLKSSLVVNSFISVSYFISFKYSEIFLAIFLVSLLYLLTIWQCYPSTFHKLSPFQYQDTTISSFLFQFSCVYLH